MAGDKKKPRQETRVRESILCGRSYFACVPAAAPAGGVDVGAGAGAAVVATAVSWRDGATEPDWRISPLGKTPWYELTE